MTVLVADVYVVTSTTIHELHDLTRHDEGRDQWDCEILGGQGGLAASLPRWDDRTVRIELFRYPTARAI